MQNVGEKTEQTNEKIKKTEGSFKTAALGFSAAASSVVSLGFQFDGLQKKSLQIEKAELALSKAKEQLQEKQSKLNEITAAGVTSGDEYSKALTEVEQAQASLQISKETLAQKEGDLQEAQIGFALQVVPTVISAVGSVIGAHAGLVGSHIMVGTSGTAAAGGITAVGLASKAAQLMMGPIGLILIGVGSALAIVATNTFGVRDAMDSWAKSVEKNFPFLKPVFDFFRSIADVISGETKPSINSLAENTGTNFALMGNEADMLSEDYLKAMNDIIKANQDMSQSVQDETEKAKKSIQELYEEMKKGPFRKQDGTVDVQKAYESLKTPKLSFGPTATFSVGDMLANPRPNVSTTVSPPLPVNPTVNPDYSQGILTGKQGDIYLAGAAGRSNGKIIVSIDEEGNLRFKDAQRNTYLDEIMVSR